MFKFPVLAADHAKNETLHSLKRMSYTVCEVLTKHLGLDTKEIYPIWDYQRYASIAKEYFESKDEQLAASLSVVGVKIDRNVFAGLSRVAVPLLFKLDILHNVYLGLFKHLMG